MQITYNGSIYNEQQRNEVLALNLQLNNTSKSEPLWASYLLHVQKLPHKICAFAGLDLMTKPFLNFFHVGVSLKICKEGGLKWIFHLLQCAEQSQIVVEGLIALNIIVVRHCGKHFFDTHIPFYLVNNSALH